jgi:hypothetical protein
MNDLRLVTAKEAADVAGYKTPRRFRLAVERGKMPRAFDDKARPNLWSLDEILGRLRRAPVIDEHTRDEIGLDQDLGIA